MRYRQLGRLGWNVSEVGFGMWGMGGWTGSDDDQSMAALHRSLELGVNFFDTAWAYGNGKSERMLGRLMQNATAPIYAATKIPPKNLRWTGLSGVPLEDVFPSEHVREYTYRSLDNLGRTTIDLQQFHCWSDDWAEDERWHRVVTDLKAEGIVRAFGISVNRWEPTNVLRALETGLIDVVQVVYNIFDQAPEDALFRVCRDFDVGVIARVPFDEGSLTGTLTSSSTWPAGDFRNAYFQPANLRETIVRVDALKALLPNDTNLADVALRFVLDNPAVATTIPGMRRPVHVQKNAAVSALPALSTDLYNALCTKRWDRTAVLP